MAHPFQQHRQSGVEHARVSQILKGSGAGAGPRPPMMAQDRGIISAAKGYKSGGRVTGAAPKARMDRPARAAGGRVKKKSGQTIVNINVGKDNDQGQAQAALPPPMPPAPPVMPPRPPMMPPPGPGPMAGPAPGLGPMPPGMPPRSQGGRAYANGGKVAPTVFNEGRSKGTQVQHSPSKSDAKNVGTRGRVITYATGGAVEAPKGKGTAQATHLPSGSGGGKARLAKQRRAAKVYAKAK